MWEESPPTGDDTLRPDSPPACPSISSVPVLHSNRLHVLSMYSHNPKTFASSKCNFHLHRTTLANHRVATQNVQILFRVVLCCGSANFFFSLFSFIGRTVMLSQRSAPGLRQTARQKAAKASSMWIRCYNMVGFLVASRGTATINPMWTKKHVSYWPQ